MPELPDVVVYVERMQALLGHAKLKRVRIVNPFVLRSVDPPLTEVEGKRVRTFKRIGKRVVMCLEDELYVVVHLMIAGRFRLRPPDTAVPKSNVLAAFDFDVGSLILTEAGRKRRASLHVVRGGASLSSFDRGGLEISRAGIEEFRAALVRDNHTFRQGTAVHGRYRKPCPVCGAPVQRIVYASSESNYCARCQTGGRLLADRALWRLLKANWPRRIEDLEG